MKIKFWIVVLTTLVSVIACNGSRDNLANDGTGLMVVGGEAVGTNEYQSVVKLTVEAATATSPEKICTGVIISHRSVLAASHCIKRLATAKDPSAYHFIAVEAGATRTKTPRKSAFAFTYKEPLGASTIAENHVALDLAILDFGQNAFSLPGYPKIATTPPVPGETVTIVGFGATSLNPRQGTTGFLNKGQNTLTSYDPLKGYIVLSGTLNAQGVPDGALAAPGDSGGPLFNARGELMGIGSALDLADSVATNYFVDLSSEESQTLIGRYLQEFGSTGPTGALIPGFTPSMGDTFASVTPRTATSLGTFTAMCGGDKGDKDKGKDKDKDKKKGGSGSLSGSGGKGDDDDDDIITVSGRTAQDKTGDVTLGKGNDGAGNKNSTGTDGSDASRDISEPGSDSPLIVVTQS